MRIFRMVAPLNSATSERPLALPEHEASARPALADEQVEGSPTAKWRNAKRIKVVCEVIDRCLADRSLDGESLARATHLSRSTLYRLVAPFGGVGSFIIRRRLEAARDVLAAHDHRDTLSELAEQVGFASASHLSRAFLDHFGMRPGEFRTAARNQGGSDLSNEGVRLADG